LVLIRKLVRIPPFLARLNVAQTWTAEQTFNAGLVMGSSRFQLAKGALVFPVTSTITLGNDGNSFQILMFTPPADFMTTTGWQIGSVVALEVFGPAVTFTHLAPAAPAGTANFRMIGNVDLIVANATIVFILESATSWRELSRSEPVPDTPWLVNHDAQSFSLQRLLNLEFFISSSTPAGPFVDSIYVDQAGGNDFTFNSAQDHVFSVQNVDKLKITPIQTDFFGNNIINAGLLNTHLIPAGAAQLVDLSTLQILLSKSIALASNTITGTRALFDTALTDDNFAFEGQANSWGEFRQTFNPNATLAGLNVGAQAGDPSTLVNGDYWYNSTSNKLRSRENAASVDVISPVMKSGRITGQIENATITITFNTAFASVPNVVATIGDIQSGQDSIVTLDNILATAFDLRIEHVGGGGAVSRDVEWIATVAGDP